MAKLAFRVIAPEPTRYAHADVNAMRLRQIAGGPIAPMPRKGVWAAIIERITTWK